MLLSDTTRRHMHSRGKVCGIWRWYLWESIYEDGEWAQKEDFMSGYLNTPTCLFISCTTLIISGKLSIYLLSLSSRVPSLPIPIEYSN